MPCHRIASSAEEALRSRLAQREQRIAELAAALDALQSRAAERRRQSSQFADGQCRDMRDAAARAESLIQRLSESGSSSTTQTRKASQGTVQASNANSSRTEGNQGSASPATEPLEATSAGQQPDKSQSQAAEAQLSSQPAPSSAVQAESQGQAGVTEARTVDTTATPEADGHETRSDMAPVSGEAAMPAFSSALEESNGAYKAGISTGMLRLAEDAEDLRLELAQRTAEAKGLQSRVDHLMACQDAHERTEAAQAAQLAEQTEANFCVFYTCCTFPLAGSPAPPAACSTDHVPLPCTGLMPC